MAGEARDGLEATDRALALAPDVVILDLELPGRDGYSVARALAALPRPPLVVVLTVHGDPAARRRAAAAGSHGFVEKGAGWPALLAAVRRALAGQAPGPPAPT